MKEKIKMKKYDDKEIIKELQRVIVSQQDTIRKLQYDIGVLENELQELNSKVKFVEVKGIVK